MILMRKNQPVLAQFLLIISYNAVNIIMKRHMNNPSCIDLIINNSPNSFQNTSTFCTGLSDFHKLVVTILKMSFRKMKF